MSARHRFSFLFLFVLVGGGVMTLAAGTSGSGALPIIDSTPIVEHFDTLSSGATSNVLPAGWYLTELGAGAAADGSYVAGTGSSNAGGAYSFGPAANAERAIGSLGSGTVTPIYYGAQFTNGGTGPITALAIAFNGEMWRRGSPTAPEGLTFSYSTDASALDNGTFTPLAALNFASPGDGCATAAGPADGNSAVCRKAIGATITNLAVAPGATIWIRWSDSDTGGSDDGLAIDDVSVTATFSTDPTPPRVTGSVAPTPAAPGQGIVLSGNILPGFNPLSQSYVVSCDLSEIGGAAAQSLPVSGTTFSYTTSVGPGTPLGPHPLLCSVVDEQHRTGSFTLAVTVLRPLNPVCGEPATPIGSVQGTAFTSPLVGLTLDVEAIVTDDLQGPGLLSGFYIQDPLGDGNPATSDGLFVFSSSPVNAGDRVRIRGTAAEFSSAGSSLTELSAVTSVQVCSTGNLLPTPVDVSLPVASVSDWERYEGMLVRFSQPLVVTGNFSLGQFGQIDLAPKVLYQPTQTPGGSSSWAAALDLVERSLITLDDSSSLSSAALNGGGLAPYPAPGLTNANTLRTGALVNPNGANPPIPLVGILDDRFGAYRIQPTAPVTFSNAPNPRPDTAAVAASAGGRVRIVSANVLNFFTTLGSRGAATPAELVNQRTKIVAELGRTGGDVLGLSELQNFENGQTSGGVYSNTAIGDLTAALASATGRNYRFIDTITLSNLVTGTSVGDNGTDAIRSGIIYNADTVVPVGQAALYNQNDQNRPSLAQTFRPRTGVKLDSQTFTVVVNHFRSKGSACGPGNDDPYQGNCNGMRHTMADNVRNWLGGNPTADPAGAQARYMLIGDFNAYYGEDPIQAFLGAGGYINLIHLRLGSDAYSYNFGSQSGYLDHAMVNRRSLALVRGVEELHINADEPAALEALDSTLKSPTAQAAYFAANEFAASDHDPIVIGFNPLLGDFNDDGVLDLKDLGALLRWVGSLVRDLRDNSLDLDGDGRVTVQDVQLWQQMFANWQRSR